MTTPDKALTVAAKTYKERHRVYGDNYLKIGPVMEAMFGEDFGLNGAEDHARFQMFVQLVTKLTRYAHNFHNGGHADSLRRRAEMIALVFDTETTDLVTNRTLRLDRQAEVIEFYGVVADLTSGA